MEQYAKGGIVARPIGPIGHTCVGPCCSCEPWQFADQAAVAWNPAESLTHEPIKTPGAFDAFVPEQLAPAPGDTTP